MRRLLPRAVPAILALTLGIHAGCGKRADPLAPYVKTPQPPSGLEIAQVGDGIEVRVVAPRTTTENRPLPVIQLEWLQSSPTGDFRKGAASVFREEVAPGELRVKNFALPTTEVRFSARAISGKARSALVAPIPFKPAPVPAAPSGLQAVNTPAGVELRWVPPPGAEPWPTPTPAATPSPSPSPSSLTPVPGLSPSPSPSTPGPGLSPSPSSLTPGPGALPSVSPVAATPLTSPTPQSSPSPQPTAIPGSVADPKSVDVAPSGIPAMPPGTSTATSPLPRPVSSPSPLPTPTPPTGIRIFRTDGAPRLAREPLQASMWLDSTVRPGEKPCYSVRYATSFKPLVESSPTDPVCVEVKDLVPPESPGRLVGDIGATFVELSWISSPSVDVATYRLYRSIGGGPRALVLQTEGLLLRVQDKDLTSGPRIYDVVAVDKGGNESPPGPPLRIIIP